MTSARSPVTIRFDHSGSGEAMFERLRLWMFPRFPEITRLIPSIAVRLERTRDRVSVFRAGGRSGQTERRTRDPAPMRK